MGRTCQELAAVETADSRQRQPRPGARRMIRYYSQDSRKIVPYGNRSPKLTRYIFS